MRWIIFISLSSLVLALPPDPVPPDPTDVSARALTHIVSPSTAQPRTHGKGSRPPARGLPGSSVLSFHLHARAYIPYHI